MSTKRIERELDWLLHEGWVVRHEMPFCLVDPRTQKVHTLAEAVHIQLSRGASRPVPTLNVDARNRVVQKIQDARARVTSRADAPTLPTTPCASCPYRRDVPVGVWHAENFERLLRADRDPIDGHTFGCHLNDGTLCRGWLLDQRGRDVPSIRLRLFLHRHDPDRAMLERVTDGGHACYESIDAMCRANGVDPDKV